MFITSKRVSQLEKEYEVLSRKNQELRGLIFELADALDYKRVEYAEIESRGLVHDDDGFLQCSKKAVLKKKWQKRSEMGLGLPTPLQRMGSKNKVS